MTAPIPLAVLFADAALAGPAAAGGLLLARVLPVVMLAPVVGGAMVSRRLRAAIALMIVLLLWPAVEPAGAVPADWGSYVGLLVKEAFIGLTLALMIVVLFQALIVAGSVIDVLRGSTLASVLDPAMPPRRSIVAGLLLQLAIVVFLTIGGLHVLIEALAMSVRAMPPFEPAPASLVGPASMAAAVGLVATMLSAALQLAAPVLIVAVLADVALALAGRVAPQIEAFFLGLTLKAWLGLLALALALATMVETFSRQVGVALSGATRWLTGG